MSLPALEAREGGNRHISYGHGAVIAGWDNNVSLILRKAFHPALGLMIDPG